MLQESEGETKSEGQSVKFSAYSCTAVSLERLKLAWMSLCLEATGMDFSGTQGLESGREEEEDADTRRTARGGGGVADEC